MMLRIASRMNKELDTDRITVDLHDEYYNMAEIIEKDFRGVDVAKQALENLDIVPIIKPTVVVQMVLRFHSWDYQRQIFLQVAKTCMAAMNMLRINGKATQVIIEIARLAIIIFN